MSTAEHIEIHIEKIPDREEVVEIFKRYATDFTVAYEQFDQYGPVLLDIEVAADVPGETIQYQYMRRGDFMGQPSRSTTTIHIVFYTDGMPTRGYNLVEYSEETREWKELNKPE